MIRRVRSIEDLTNAIDVLRAQFEPAIESNDERFSKLYERFAEDRHLMLVVEEAGRITGGALAFRGESSATVRIIALESEARGQGLGRRLMEIIEIEAMAMGLQTISLGADQSVKPFYERLGYHGRSSMHKGLPLPGPVLEAKLKKLLPSLGDLDAGEQMTMGHH